MINLSEFVGEIISGLAKARNMSDYRSAEISEQYHADPFIKDLPVPHYTIDEAEIEVPVIVSGLQSNGAFYKKALADMAGVMEEKLPPLIERSYFFHEKRTQEDKTVDRQKSAQNVSSDPSNNVNRQPRHVSAANSANAPNFDGAASKAQERETTLKQKYQISARSITANVCNAFQNYLDAYNYKLVKLLDFTEFFADTLYQEITADQTNYTDNDYPFQKDEDKKSAVSYIGNILFFELESLLVSHDGVQVDVITSNMNEYDDNSCVMRIKLKIREQDLTLQTEERSGKTRRYLTLT